ncbi:MAG: hypothetical protein HZA91_12835 [Verrucomicrobia bacterium]|nr:hypothetical protein [Verrucomicrobiota bacterium]
MNRHPALTSLSSVLATLAFAGWLHAQSTGGGFDEPRPHNPIAPGGPDGGLFSHNVQSATSKDGLTWTRDEGIRFASASVPCAINDGDRRVLLYFVQPPNQPGRPETVACAVSTDGMTFKQEPAFQIEGLSTVKAVDPSILKDGAGKFRLYYLASDHRGDPARGANPHKICAALSDDGVRFRETGSVFEYDDLVDPDVFRYKGKWFMYVFAKGGTVIATSADGNRFTYAGVMSPRDWGTTAPVALPDGRLRLYAFEQRVPEANAVHSFISTDGIHWTPESGDRLRANAGEQITDPFVVPWRGGFKMYFKSSPARKRHDQAMNPPQPAGNPGAPPNNADGPWNRDVIAYRVSATGAVEKAATFERAGVPTLARLKDGRLIVAHQHFPENDRGNFDKVAVRFSSDDGRTWTAPQVIKVASLPEGMRFPFDPTLVPLPDGRVRLYFTGNYGRTFRHSTPAIHSAISADGVNYTYEPGVRFGVEGRAVIDCAVVLHQGVFHLFSPDNGAGPDPGRQRGSEPAADRPRQGVGYHATSKDGLNFTRVADVQIEGRRSWLGNAQSDGQLITFYGTGEGMSTGGGGRPRGAFWMATSADGQNWKLTANPPVGGGDPGAVKTRDGGLLVVITGEPVRGTTSRRISPPDAGGRGQIRVERVESKYAVAPAAKAGRFVTGQNADLMLGGFGFNNTGGALRFNHPTGLATDGRALLMTDRWNNRVLIWKSAPAKNTPPDLVLGQPDFTQNNPGAGMHQLNWPGNVAITPDGSRVAVTDTDNERILIWNSVPARNGAPADIVLELKQLDAGARDLQRPGRPMHRLGWPWGVWTDGKKLAVVATHGAAVLIWNSLPARDNQPPDMVLRPRNAGTPRNVTSDGNWFAVSDHNNGERSRPGTMVWRAFPTEAAQEPDFTWGEWLKGTFTPDRKLIMAGIRSIYIWNEAPRDNGTDAAVMLRPDSYRNGDGPDAVIAGGRLYVCSYNGNNVLVWNSAPTRDDQPPDFALGSDTPEQDTWAEDFFIQNPVVATDGRSLLVSSDFNRKMFVWRSLPDESAAKPDLVFHLPEGPWDNALHGSTLALAGKRTVYVWKKPPLNGEPPDVELSGRIGSIELQEITGVALDDRYFYLSDRQAGAIYVWEGIPARDSEPKFTLSVERPGRLSSDGTHLAAAPFEGQSVSLWRVADLRSDARPTRIGGHGRFNLPGKCIVSHGHLFVADTGFHRVHVWHRVEDALAGRPADALLGARDDSDRDAGIGRASLFMPGTVAFGGGYLWVGEFKFSTRILRFGPQQK